MDSQYNVSCVSEHVYHSAYSLIRLTVIQYISRMK
jgi:hypothetical protein